MWIVQLADEFEPEFMRLSDEVQNEAIAVMSLLQKIGPQLARPRVDTLKESRYANMKELRFDADGGVWRLAFAFDPERKAIVLVAGDKSGGSEKRFYRELIRKADIRFKAHLEHLEERGHHGKKS